MLVASECTLYNIHCSTFYPAYLGHTYIVDGTSSLVHNVVHFIVGQGPAVASESDSECTIHSTRYATPSSLLIREGFSGRKILTEFSNFFCGEVFCGRC